MAEVGAGQVRHLGAGWFYEDLVERTEMGEKLTIKQCQERLGCARSTTYKLLAHEPGVYRYYIAGSKKPIIRVDAAVIDRILQRSANRAS
jgi:hypothetical protein